MTNIHQAFKAVAPGTVNFEGVSGGIPTDKNIAHGELAGLCENSYTFGLAKYGDDEHAKKKLYEIFVDFAEKTARRNGWRVNKMATLHGAARIAIDMHLYPQLGYCRTCRGSKSSSPGVKCMTCDGTGKKSIKNTEIAIMLDVNESKVRSTWGSRIDKLYCVISDWDSLIH